MSSFLDKIFYVSIILKGLDGILELIGGVLLLLLSPAYISRIVADLTQHELATDPHDFIANFLFSSTQHLNGSVTLFGAFYLISHGLVKVVLVVALLKQKLWAYPWMIGFLLIFIGYQIYKMVTGFSTGLLLLTLFDIFIVWLTLLEYRKHKDRLSAELKVKT